MKRALMFLISISMIFTGFDAYAVTKPNNLKTSARATNNLAATPPRSVTRRSSGFTLKDQNEASYAVKFPREKVTVLIFGDREGAEQIEGWVRPIYNQFGSKIDVYGIAELSAVPSLMRGIVRRVIKQKTKYSVLLDWSGAVSKTYGYQKGKANVVVLDKNGRVIGRRTGAANRYGLLGVYKYVNSGL